ncbi:hypothetical protein ES332_A05G236700v1 [Gossypium tomentosum]|uniref:Uncharacterized protein n=1 Tax=Gossypium tomentosum TaxID=34277 RepID=A0A5D2QIV8_GOSTO|nr:hypothetical protein ES332_A05G236700v1 [Gossypium tomentosum]
MGNWMLIRKANPNIRRVYSVSDHSNAGAIFVLFFIFIFWVRFNYIDIKKAQIQLLLISNSPNIELDFEFVEFRSYLLSKSYKYVYFKINELVILILDAFNNIYVHQYLLD